MEIEYLIKLIKILLDGLSVSVEIFGLTLIFSIPLGILVAVCSISQKRILSCITKIYILIMRGTPLLLQIICIYFAPYYLFGLSYDRFIALIIAFSLNYAAYLGEIFRSGIESIPVGQKEAAFTLGFNKLQTFFLIVFPQAIKKTIPSISNEVITLVRDTSLAQVIGITELFSLAQKQANFRFSIIPLILAAIIYLGISLILTLIFNYIEKKLNYYRG